MYPLIYNSDREEQLGVNFLLRIYILFLGFISAFALTETVSIPMIIALLTAVFIFFNNSKNKNYIKIYPSTTFLFFLLTIAVLLSFLIQINDIGFHSTSLNHTIAYFTVILIFYGVPKLAFDASRPKLETLFKYISHGVILVSIIIVTEFTLKNFLGIDFDQFIPRPANQNYNPTFASGKYIRARGVASESGNMAMYMMMFAPFLAYYYGSMKKNKYKLIFYLSLISTSIILTFSAAALVDLVFAGTVSILLIVFKKAKSFKLTRKSLLTISLTIFILPIIALLFTKINFNYFTSIFDKLTLSETSSSASDRVMRWERTFKLFQDSPVIGDGPGITSFLYGTGSTSFYIETLAELGILGISILMLIFLLFFMKAYKLYGGIRYVYIFSLTACLVHYFGISSFWYPWLWLLLSIIGYTYNLQYSRMKKNNSRLYRDVG